MSTFKNIKSNTDNPLNLYTIPIFMSVTLNYLKKDMVKA